MRKQLCEALIVRAKYPNMVFLTGDLGFMAFEPLQISLESRFINAGVAEQNMISVAAGLAAQSLETWVYSIAPFCYARPFEQIRNDIAFHNLPVKLLGNGGGYGYGVMGPTHHAIEDYGVLLTLPHFRVLIPTFDEDIDAVISLAARLQNPLYIRLGRGEAPQNYVIPKYSAWRQLTNGEGMVVVAVGPIAGSLIDAFQQLTERERPNLWVISELPIHLEGLPEKLLHQLMESSGICVVEEHVERGSVGSELALLLLKNGIKLNSFYHFYSKAHHFSSYGSQGFLRVKSQLDPQSIINAILKK